MTDLAPAQTEALDALRAVLPPVVTDLDSVGLLNNLVCIDCEWDPDTGALETIGVGNAQLVVQLAWPADDEFVQCEIRLTIEGLVLSHPVVYQNAIADIKKLREHGFKIHPATHREINDVMLADAVLESEEAHDLEDINRRHGRLPDWKLLRDVAPREYNAADVVAPVLLWREWFAKAFARDPAAEAVYHEQSLAFLCEIQVETEEAGIRVDKSKPYALYDRYDLKRKQATLLAQAYCGFPVNLGSPDDMKHMLYTVDGLPPQYAKGGGPYPDLVADRKLSTDKDAIAALRRAAGTEWDPDDPPTLEAAWHNVEAGGNPLLEARYLFLGSQQAISHYIQSTMILDEKGKVTGLRDRIYPEIRQHVQASGRHSFVNPALQQFKGALIETPSGLIPELQTLITPDPGTVWVGWDWSQIEVRLLAYLADDQPYLDAYARGEDVHERNRLTLFGPQTGNPETTEVQRRFTKVFVFRLHYRGKPENAGDIPGVRLLGLNRDRLVEIAESYMAEHPAIVEYWERLEQQIEKYRVVYSFMGRPRRLTSQYRAARIREGSNDPMQAGVSDIYVTTALRVKRVAPWARFVEGKHDSQNWQVPSERAAEFRALIEPIAQRTFEIGKHAAVFPASFKQREAA